MPLIRGKGPSHGKHVQAREKNSQGSAVVELAVALLAIVTVFSLVSEGQKAFKLYEDMESMTQTAARFASTLSPASTSQIDLQTKQFIDQYYLGRGSLLPYANDISVTVEQLGLNTDLDMAPQGRLSPGDIMKATSKILINGNNQFKSKIFQGGWPGALERSYIFTYMKNEVGEVVSSNPAPPCCEIVRHGVPETVCDEILCGGCGDTC